MSKSVPVTLYRGPLQRNVLTLALCCFVTAHLHAPICPLWHPEDGKGKVNQGSVHTSETQTVAQ